jgi:BlaI family penicillinase repressor
VAPRARATGVPAFFVILARKLLRAASTSATLCHVTYSNTSNRSLTELQQAILDFIWSGGPATADQVREALLPKHPLKDSSVRTLLRRLEAQGYLRHRLQGKSFLYEAALPSRSVAARVVQQVIDRFCSGSAEQFLVGMVDEKVLSVGQIERLARKVRTPK